MRIVILGGLGFIGLEFAKRLINLGHSVLAIDSLEPQIHGEIPSVVLPNGLEFKRLDLCNISENHELLEGCDAVYHLVAETGTAQSMYRVAHYVAVNDLGTAKLIEALAKCDRRPQKVVLASSRSVYGEGAYRDKKSGVRVQPAPRSPEQLQRHEWDPVGANDQAIEAIATPEDLPFAPGSVYAATKASQELLLSAALPALGIKGVIFRFQNVYGEGQSLQNPYTGIISIFFNRARQGMGISIYEDGEETRDFIHIRDIVQGLVKSLEAEVPAGLVMNLGTGEPTSVLHLAQTLQKVSGFTVPTKITAQYRVGDIRHGWADLTTAKAHLGFQPEVSLEEGLTQFVSWAQNQPKYVDRLDVATEELKSHGLAG